MRFRLRTYLILIAVIAVFLWAIISVRRTLELVENAYAAEWAALLLIRHLETNNDQWPTGWSDLVDDFIFCQAKYDAPFSFNTLQEHVEIDWNSDPNTWQNESTNGAPPSRKIIWLRNRKDHHWVGIEPNDLVFRYLTTGETPD